jgi:hypothetical protein
VIDVISEIWLGTCSLIFHERIQKDNLIHYKLDRALLYYFILSTADDFTRQRESADAQRVNLRTQKYLPKYTVQKRSFFPLSAPTRSYFHILQKN